MNTMLNLYSRLKAEKLLIIISLFFFCIRLTGQVPVIQFEKCFGGSNQELWMDIKPSGDTGYVVIGTTLSEDGDIHDSHGSSEIWVVQLNKELDTLWTRCIGGSSSDMGYSIRPIADGAYAFCGYSNSADGDLTGNFGNFDAIAGRISHNRDTFDIMNTGGSENEMFADFLETSDNVFVIGGISESTDGFVHDNHGNNDIWIMKIALDTDTLWTRCYGGTQTDNMVKLVQTHDDGIVVGGITTSTDGDVHGNHGSADIFVMKINGDGDTLWTKCYGGYGDEVLFDIRQTSDNGFIMAGYSNVADGDVYTNYGETDYWIVKLNSDGDTLWTRCFGGSDTDIPYAAIETTDGGYLIGGHTYSSDGQVHGNHGERDIWIVRLDPQGDTLWTKCFGGSGYEQLYDLLQTDDNGIIFIAETESEDGDVSYNHGLSDAWLVKLCYPSEVMVDTTICEGSSYFAGGELQSEAGTYYDVYENMYGCDSIVTTILQVEQCEVGAKQVSCTLPDIYPNPTTGILHIGYENAEEIYLLDLTGKILLHTNEREINLSAFSRGIYYIKVVDTGGTQYTAKIVFID